MNFKHFSSTLLFLVLTIGINQLNAQWIQISSGTEFTMVLKADGTLWTWGFNGNGQLGLGLPEGQIVSTPTQVGTDQDWKYVTTGAVHTMAIKEDGTLWGWGSNVVNQLGDGTTLNKISPVMISTDTDWLIVYAGQGHNLAIKTDSSLWAWGFNAFGQVGNGLTGNVPLPEMISADMDWEMAACGGAHSLAIKRDGTLYSWGANFNGQLGNGANNPVLIPTQITNQSWLSISCGFEFSVAIQEDSTLWTWGFNGNGQLGNGGTTDRNTPGQIDQNLDISWDKISAGPAFSLAITNEGYLYGWGANINGCLGLGELGPVIFTPTLIDDDEIWVEAKAPQGLAQGGSVFGFHSMGLKSDRDVICVAGSNYISQLGTGDQLDRTFFECIVGQLMVAVQNYSNIQTFFAFPNPASNSINLKGPDSDAYNVSIWSSDGKMILNITDFKGSQQIDIEHLQPGLYYFNIADQGTQQHIKFIKSN